MAELYPAADPEAAHASECTLARDRRLAALHVWAKARAESRAGPTYLYLWSHWGAR